MIELATPHLLEYWPERIRSVMLATGEAPDSVWLEAFCRCLKGVQVQVVVRPAFGYVSEQRLDENNISEVLARELESLFSDAPYNNSFVWAHNLGLGRNLYLTRALALFCHRHGIPLLAHHHDWWFENRWHHFAALEAPAFRRLNAVAEAVLAGSPQISHVAINLFDAKVLERYFKRFGGWLPDPIEPETPPSPKRIRAARLWLRKQIGEDAPVWLLPCRLLRRKNIAEALLLTRWLRPEAWLVTTGGASSAEEQPYAAALEAAAKRGNLRLRLGVLQGDESAKPTVPELMAASEAVLLTSIQEGFGLPYLEAVAVGRPLLARSLPNIAPDLDLFGFKFPHTYDELLIEPTLFDWKKELARQKRMFAKWKHIMPSGVRKLVELPVLLAAAGKPRPVPFSRLSLAAQLEVLEKPPEYSWACCMPLNPFLQTWRQLASAGELKTIPWPRSANQWIGGRAFAKRFLEIAPLCVSKGPPPGAGIRAQTEFLRKKLRAEYIYPILWNSQT